MSATTGRGVLHGLEKMDSNLALSEDADTRLRCYFEVFCCLEQSNHFGFLQFAL